MDLCRFESGGANGIRTRDLPAARGALTIGLGRYGSITARMFIVDGGANGIRTRDLFRDREAL